MVINCDLCKKEFDKKPSLIAKHTNHYCCKSCANKGQRLVKQRGVIIQCKECDINVYKTRSELKKSKKGNHFCGRSCSQIYYGKNHQRENHPNWKGGVKTFRKIAFEEYGKVCNRCNFSAFKEILQVHHINHDNSDNSLENLEVLCPNCHQIEHIVLYGGTMNKPS